MKSTFADTVVLLHSSASSARQWSALQRRLPPAPLTLAVDLYGHGARAPWPHQQPMRLADEAALVLPLLHAAGGAHLVGHSYGAAVALKIALLQPQLVKSVVLYEPVLFAWLFDDPSGAAARHEALNLGNHVAIACGRGELDDAAARFVDYWSGPGTWAAMPRERQQPISRRMRDVQRQFATLLAEPMPPAHVARLPMPMLCLSGGATVASTRRIAAILRRAAPQAEHALLPDAGHMGPLTHAEAFNQRVCEFLQQPREAVAEAALPATAVLRWSPAGWPSAIPGCHRGTSAPSHSLP